MDQINSQNITSNITQEELIVLISQISLTFVMLVLIIISIMFLHNKSTKSRKIAIERFNTLFQDLLIQYIHTPNSEYKSKLELLDKIHMIVDKFDVAEILKLNIMNLAKLFKCELKIKLENFYYEMGFYEEANKNLKSKNWKIQVKALRELSNMNIKKSRELILKLTYSTNTRVSTTAIQCIIEIDKNPFSFLLERKVPIINAQTMIISQKAMQMIDTPNVELIQLLNHPEPSIIILGIKLIQNLKFNEAKYQLATLLTHHNEDIQVHAFIALAYLDPKSSSEILKQYYLKAKAEIIQKLSTNSNSYYQKLPFEIDSMLKNHSRLNL